MRSLLVRGPNNELTAIVSPLSSIGGLAALESLELHLEVRAIIFVDVVHDVRPRRGDRSRTESEDAVEIAGPQQLVSGWRPFPAAQPGDLLSVVDDGQAAR